MHFTSWVFPKGHRMRAGRLQRPVADDLADAVCDDDAALDLGGTDGSRLVLPVIPPEARPRPEFAAPGAVDRGGRRAVHRAAPGRASGRSAATRSGRRRTGTGAAPRRRTYPWGTVASSEQMTYDVADAHPESARDGRATPRRPSRCRTASCPGRCTSRSRATRRAFTTSSKRELRKDGVLIREKSGMRRFLGTTISQ